MGIIGRKRRQEDDVEGVRQTLGDKWRKLKGGRSSLPTPRLATSRLALPFFTTPLSSFLLTSPSSGGQGSCLDVVADPTVWVNASDTNHTCLSFLG